MSHRHHRGQRMFGCAVTGHGMVVITDGCRDVGSEHALAMSMFSQSGCRAPRDGNFVRVDGRTIRAVIERIHTSATIVPRGIEGKVIAEVLEDCWYRRRANCREVG